MMANDLHASRVVEASSTRLQRESRFSDLLYQIASMVAVFL
jgi:hypothetical protein